LKSRGIFEGAAAVKWQPDFERDRVCSSQLLARSQSLMAKFETDGQRILRLTIRPVPTKPQDQKPMYKEIYT
jgi:hypothetical protein